MGFYEDDRIASKNRIHNEAYQLYQSLCDRGYTDNDIQQYLKELNSTQLNFLRNEVYSTALRLAVGRSDEDYTGFGSVA